MIVYFSGTGNSRFCAQVLAEHLADDCLDSFSYIQNGIAADLISEKPWVFVSPTYAWRIPKIFTEFIKSGDFKGNTDAYFVMTCGDDVGNAQAYLQQLCAEKGLRFCGVLPVVMPENYLAMFEVPEAEEAAEICAHAKPVLQEAAAVIRQGRSFENTGSTFLDSIKSGLVNRLFYPLFVHAKSFRVKPSCIGCGQCVNRCVMNNIELKNGTPVWSDRCTHCMACICGCPAEAIEYGSKSVGKPRYWCKSE